MIDRRDFFFFLARFTSFHTQAFLLAIFVVTLFHSCCSHARVFGKTLAHEFPISYSHTEWYLHFSRGEIVCLGRSFVYHNQIKLNSCKHMREKLSQSVTYDCGHHLNQSWGRRITSETQAGSRAWLGETCNCSVTSIQAHRESIIKQLRQRAYNYT